MYRIFRTLLLWILIAALPLQGLAATRISCELPVHGASAVSAQMPMAHHHSMHAADVSHEAPPAEDHHPTAKHAGGNCANCCIGMAALPALPLAPAPVFVSGPASAVPAPFFATVFPSGLERPPKRFSS